MRLQEIGNLFYFMSPMDNSARSIATYYHPGAQEGLQTLYLMNQGFPLYADEPTTAEVHMLNSPGVGAPLNPGVPLHQRIPVHEISNPLQDFSASSHHRLWGSAVAPQLGLRQPQGLSLTLSPQRTAYALASAGEVRVTIAASASGGPPNGVSYLQSLWVGSKYLKAAQQLLEEVASVGGKNRSESLRESGKKYREERRGLKQAAELTASERQELQMKKAKLLHMFEDLEKRYKLYHNQMQTVVTSFEAAAGVGAARTYTALALQTISKQFRCLRDTISWQIREASRCLGEEDGLGGEKLSSSRLSLIGSQIRQQRALQQIAIMQQSAWRPQRGLPERSVSILRAWLFEHFLHPYPKDSDKQMLAKQTGLTRSQVSNWFINARVRLWKPMVEEMYLEEVKEGAEQSSGEENCRNPRISPSETEQTILQLPPIGSPRQATVLNGAQALDQSNSMEIANGDGGFDYAGAEQFGARGLGKGVSLTLGLPHSENLSLSRGHPAFLSRDGVSLGRRVEIGNGNNKPSVALNSITFQGVDVQSSKRLAAQLLRDFVA